jgi:hypothetical protein
MPRPPLSRERICDALESCRPGSNDLYAPDLAEIAGQVAENPQWEEVYERIQNSDLKISAAFHDVEVPVGLEQRLVASLKLSQAEDAISAALKSDTDIETPSDAFATPSAKKYRAVSRRWLITACGILTVTAALFLVVFLGMNNGGGYTEQTVLNEAIDIFNADLHAAPGRLLVQAPAPREFPLSKAIWSFGGIRWRTVKNFIGCEGVAYDLPAQGGRATLYVVDRTISGLGIQPVEKPSNTGGRCVAAWQEGGLLYVLVVQGNQKSYKEYLNLPHGPMA